MKFELTQRDIEVILPALKDLSNRERDKALRTGIAGPGLQAYGKLDYVREVDAVIDKINSQRMGS